MTNRDHQACCNQSILLQNYDVESLSGFLNVLFSEDEMSYLQKEQKRKSRTNTRSNDRGRNNLSKSIASALMAT